MASEALKLAKIEKAQALNRDLMVLTKDIIALATHPVYSVVLAVALIEALEKVKIGGQPLMGNVIATSLETVLITGGVVESVAGSGILQSLISAKTGGLSNLLTAGN